MNIDATDLGELRISGIKYAQLFIEIGPRTYWLDERDGLLVVKGHYVPECPPPRHCTRKEWVLDPAEGIP